MFTILFKRLPTRVIKSGLLCDFIFKKVVYSILRKNFLVYNIYFSEKYIIEYLFNSLTRWNLIIWSFIENIGNNFSHLNLGILIAFVLLLCLVFIN